MSKPAFAVLTEHNMIPVDLTSDFTGLNDFLPILRHSGHIFYRAPIHSIKVAREVIPPTSLQSSMGTLEPSWNLANYMQRQSPLHQQSHWML